LKAGSKKGSIISGQSPVFGNDHQNQKLRKALYLVMIIKTKSLKLTTPEYIPE
jgi:hypothetical protein